MLSSRLNKKLTLKTEAITITGTSVISELGSVSNFALNSLQTRALADLRKIPTVYGPFRNSSLSIFCVKEKKKVKAGKKRSKVYLLL